MITCDIGDPVRLRTVATNRETGKPLNPAKIVCTVESPDGTLLTPTVEAVEGTEDTYDAFVTPVEAEKWEYAFDFYDAKGEPIGSKEGAFRVRERKVPRD